MLMKCPKCGFSQPQDQYCAQCGIDMVSYKPPQKSTLSVILRDPLFHFSVVIIAAIIGATTIYRKNKTELEQRVTYLKGNFPQKINDSNSTTDTSAVNAANSAQPAGATSGSTEVTAQNSAGLTATASSSPDSSALPATPDSNLASTNTKAGFLPTGQKSKKSNVKVKVLYVEVSQRVYESLVEESSKAGQFNNFGDYSAGIISQFSKKSASLGREFNILRTDVDAIDIGKSLNWSFNYRSSEREPASPDISLSTFVNLEDSEGSNFKGNLEIVRSQKESVDPNLSSIQKNNYPAVFEIPAESAFFMAGLGNHRADPAQPGATAKADSELIVLVQFEKGQ